MQKNALEDGLEFEEERFWAFSGTTEENYRTCLVQEGNEAKFDKSKERKHRFSRIYKSNDFNSAASYASVVSSKIGSTPLVMSGRVDIKYQERNTLELGVPFPVERVWIHRGDNPLDSSQYKEVDPLTLE